MFRDSDMGYRGRELDCGRDDDVVNVSGEIHMSRPNCGSPAGYLGWPKGVSLHMQVHS